jgi:endogenous inhibitor of DNA gyrase (YacG/DUF329 family)
MPATRTVRCPQCGKAVEWTPASKFRPFCSERCKMLDFGAWAAEVYRVPAIDAEEDADPSGGADETPQR